MNIDRAKTPVIQYSHRWDSGSCEYCGAEITSSTRFGRIWATYIKRGVRYARVDQICAHCLLMESASDEAKADERRFTAVCVAADGTALAHYMGSRCSCGAAALLMKGFCVQCWRASRMLKKAQFEIREIKSMTAQINKQIKEQIKNGTQ